MAKLESKLNDKKWVSEQYVDNKSSASEISELLGCSQDAVRKALIKHGIKRRNASEATKAKFERNGGKSRLYEVLNDSDWLVQKYVEEGLGINRLAVLAGAKNHNSVRQALMRFGIPLRSISDGLTINRIDDNFRIDKNVLVGCLLGDGSFRSYNKQSDQSYPMFCKRNKYYDHVAFVVEKFFGEDGLARIKDEYGTCNGKRCRYFGFHSLTHKELMPIYREWYPLPEGIKVVPQNVEINPEVLLHWFLDDGTSSWRKRKYPNGWIQRKKQVEMQFCSESFTKSDNEILIDKIGLLGIKCSLRKCQKGTGYRIRILQRSTNDFLDLIGPSPIKSLAYKWKYV